jgi:hypothetical protein
MSLEHPTFTFVPDFTSPPRFGIATNHDKTAMGQAQQAVMFPQRRPDFIFSHSFAIATALEIQQLKEFFRARGGRTHPFFLPSWKRDLTLVEPVAAGEKQIPIISPDEDYAAQHLDDTDPDHYGRTLYFWRDGEEVWTERVIRVLPGDEAGQEILDLDTPLPFAIDDRTWIGWAHLSRFTEDRIEWKHSLPSVAECEISFRATRHANQNELTVAIEQIDQYGQLGFIECTVAPGEVLPVTNRVAYAFGPEDLHATQDDPFSEPWAAFPSSDGIHIQKATPPEFEVIWLPSEGGSLSILFDEEIETDHVALAFDQNAYEVIAYQKAPTTIEVRRFFNLAVEVVEFEGQDPLLQYNALLDQDLPTGETDVVCYYIKPGQNALWMRFQRDNFETEYLAALLPGRPIALKRAYFVYNEDASEGTLKVEFLDAGYRVGTLSSDGYPDPPPPPIDPQVYSRPDPDTASAGTGALTGTYENAIIYADGGAEDDPHPPFEDGSRGTFSVAGSYDLTALDELLEEQASGTFGATGSHTLYVFAPATLDTDQSDVTIGATGDYELIAIVPGVSDEIATTTINATGVYEPA